jgi:hypothetical protein
MPPRERWWYRRASCAAHAPQGSFARGALVSSRKCCLFPAEDAARMKAFWGEKVDRLKQMLEG